MAYDPIVAKNLTRLRKEAGLSKASLSRMAGISSMALARLEGMNGGSMLTAEYAKMLAPLLKKAPEDLLFPAREAAKKSGINVEGKLPQTFEEGSLPALVVRAARALAAATTAAEILDARDQASFSYDIAKKSARFAKAKGAHDDLVAKAHRAQADALEIEAQAKRRLADEYDLAQERGEIGKRGDFGGVTSRGEDTPTAADLGLSHKEIHEARMIRDAEMAEPGLIRRTLDARLSDGLEPTKAALRETIVEVARPAPKEPKPVDEDARTARRHRRAIIDVVQACMEMAEQLDLEALQKVVTILDRDEVAQIRKARDTLDAIVKAAK